MHSDDQDNGDDLPGIQQRSITTSHSPKVFKDNESNDSGEKEEYKLYRYRMFELTLYCLAIMVNMICWMSLQPIPGALQNGYGVSSTVIGSMGFMFMLVFIPVNFPSTWVLERYGLKTGILMGSAFTTIGMWVKCLIN
jgi:fucose permease